MALSTSRTVVTETGLSTNSTYNVGGVLAGVSNLHTIGYDVVDSNTGTGVTVRSTGNAVFSGVITASKFVGDISDATGAAAGLGTALSQTQTDSLNKVYFTNNILEFSSTTTIDHPSTTNTAYTNYSDIKITGSADLIIKDGSGNVIVQASSSDVVVSAGKTFKPATTNSTDLGTTNERWRVIYTNDLELSNKGSSNSVDGTWGDWTLQEGENKIFMINNRTGKKYSLKMEEE